MPIPWRHPKKAIARFHADEEIWGVRDFLNLGAERGLGRLISEGGSCYATTSTQHRLGAEISMLLGGNELHAPSHNAIKASCLS